MANNHKLKVSLAIGLVLALAGMSGAVDKHWDAEGGINARWDLASNWDFDALPDFVLGDDIIFDTFDNSNPTTLDDNRTINSLTFNTELAGYIYPGASTPNAVLTIKTGNITRNDLAGTEGNHTINADIALGATGAWTINGSGTLAIGGIVSGNYGLDISGATAVKLDGDNTFSGNLTYGGTSTLTVNGAHSGAGNVTVNSGTVTIGASGRITNGGTTTINGGIVNVANADALGGSVSAVALGGTGGATTAKLTINVANVDLARNISVQAGNTGAVTINGTQNSTFSGTIGLNRDLTVDASSGKLVMFSGIISDESGTNNLVKATTAGAVVLGAVNSYGGTTTISGGMLAVDATGSIGSSRLIFNGGVWGQSGSFSRPLGTTGGDVVCWNAGKIGGFAAYGGDLTVDLGGDGASNLVWESTPGFIANAVLKFGSPLATNKVTFVDNINLNNRNRTIQVDDNTASNDDMAEISGVISNDATARSITKSGAGRLILSGNNTFTGAVTLSAGQLVLTGSNAYIGATTLTAGTMALGTGGSIQAASVMKFNGSGVWAQSGTFSRSLGTGGSDAFAWNAAKGGGFAAYGADLTVDIGGGGADSLVWASTASFIGAATMYLNSDLSDAKVTLIDNIDLNAADRTISVNENVNSEADMAEVSGVISGSASLIKAGNGTLILSGENTFLGSPTNFDRQGVIYNYTPGLKLTGSNYVTDIVLAGHDEAFGPGSVVMGTNKTIASLGAYGAARTLDNPYIILDAGGNFFVGDEDLIITGIITDMTGSTNYRSLYKKGAGDLVLTNGNNDYAGSTTIYEGRLLVDGALLFWSVGGSMNVAVQSGGTLGGLGVIDRVTNVTAGGTLQPGHDGRGLLMLRSLFMEDGAVLDVELGALSQINDRIDVDRTLQLDGIVNIADAGGLQPGLYTLMRYNLTGGSFYNNGLALGTVPAGWEASYLVDPATTPGLVQAMMVPEPATVAMLALGGLGLVMRRRLRA